MNNKFIKLISMAILPLGMALVVPASAAADLKAGRAAFDASSCGSCHHASATTIGPSLKEIARRYHGKPVAAELAQRIRAGSAGRWGEVPHPAYEGMDASDALLMATWILGGAPR